MKSDFEFLVLRNTKRASGAIPASLAVSPPASTRRSRRHSIKGIPVTVEAPSLSDEGWVVGGIDINVDGMGLALPREIPSDTFVLVSCHLDARASFVRLPAYVLHSDDDGSGVRFEAWHEVERLMLMEYLLRRDAEPE